MNILYNSVQRLHSQMVRQRAALLSCLLLLWPLIADSNEMLMDRKIVVGFAQDTLANDWRLAQARELEHELSIHHNIQLLITDVNLLPAAQTRTGYALAQRWHAMHPELPIILISGDPGNEDFPEVRSGALGFLLKPFRLDALLEVVQRVLGR